MDLLHTWAGEYEMTTALEVEFTVATLEFTEASKSGELLPIRLTMMRPSRGRHAGGEKKPAGLASHAEGGGATGRSRVRRTGTHQ